MGVQFAGNILVQSNGGPLPISMGGTGQTTATNAINALLPVQTGNAGYVLTTNGTNVSWSASSGGTPGGADTQIQFNDSGTFGGLSSLVINKTTGAVTGTSTFTNAGTNITGAAATVRPLKIQTAGSDRWLLQANATAESGSNAGSNFEFVRVADNGSTQNQVFTVARSTGVVDFKATPTINGTPIGSGSGTVTSVAVTSANGAITISGSPITSSGTISVTANNFTTSVAGVVPASGGGTTNFLRADGTWAAPTATTTSLTGTGAVTIGTTMGVYAGVASGLVPALAMSNSSRPVDNRIWGAIIDQTNGNFVIRPYSDTLTAGTNSISMSRSGNTTTSITLNATAVNLTDLTSGLQINSSAGTSGQVLTSQGASAAPIWASASVTALNGTGTPARSGTTTGIYAGVDGASQANVTFTNGAAAAGARASHLYTDSTGNINWALLTDNLLSQTAFMTVARSGNTATEIRFIGTAIDLAVGTGGLQINNSAGTSGQVLTSQGASAAPIWSSPSITALNGTGTITLDTATTAFRAGTASSEPAVSFTQSAAAANNKLSTIRVNTSGTLRWTFNTDANAETTWMNVTRSGATASLITYTATGMNLALGTSGLQLNGSAGTSGQVLTSQGASAAPIWASPNVTSLTATAAAASRTVAASTVWADVRGGTPLVSLANATPAVDSRAWSFQVTTGGTLQLIAHNDTFTAGNSVMDIARSGTSATTMTLSPATLNLSGLATGGLQVNGSAGTSGQVLTSNGSAAAPTWAAPVAAAGTLTGTTLNSTVVTSSLTSVGTLSSLTTSGQINNTSGGIRTTGVFTYTNASTQAILGVNGSSESGLYLTNATPASTDNRTFRYVVDSSGSLQIGPVNNSGTSNSAITIARNGATVDSVTLAGTAITLTGAVTATSVSAPVTGSLLGSGNRTVSSATTAALVGVMSGAASGTFNGRATEALVSSSATAGNRVWGRQVDGSGNLYDYLWDDTQSAGTAWLQVARSANTASTITLTGTSIVPSGSVDFGTRYTELSSSLTATASTTINCSLANNFAVTMSASITTLTFSNVPTTGRVYNMTLFLAQDATGGRSITWPASVKWPGGTAPTLSGANKTDIITLVTYNGGTTWFGFVAGLNY